MTSTFKLITPGGCWDPKSSSLIELGCNYVKSMKPFGNYRKLQL